MGTATRDQETMRLVVCMSLLAAFFLCAALAREVSSLEADGGPSQAQEDDALTSKLEEAAMRNGKLRGYSNKSCGGRLLARMSSVHNCLSKKRTNGGSWICETDKCGPKNQCRTDMINCHCTE